MNTSLGFDDQIDDAPEVKPKQKGHGTSISQEYLLRENESVCDSSIITIREFRDHLLAKLL